MIEVISQWLKRPDQVLGETGGRHVIRIDWPYLRYCEEGENLAAFMSSIAKAAQELNLRPPLIALFDNREHIVNNSKVGIGLPWQTGMVVVERIAFSASDQKIDILIYQGEKPGKPSRVSYVWSPEGLGVVWAFSGDSMLGTFARYLPERQAA